MNEYTLLMHIISGCDEALKDAFIRRMEASKRLAQAKLDSGSPIYDPSTAVPRIEQIASEFSPELSPKADSLWSALHRMSRNVQYRYMLQALPDYKMEHEHDLVEVPEADTVWCAAEDEALVAEILGIATHSCDSTEDAMAALVRGEADAAAVVIPSMYHIEQLYSQMYDKPVYINQIVRTGDKRCVALLSKKLVNFHEDSIIALAISTPARHGSLSQNLLIFAEALITIEHMRIRRNNGEGELLDNMTFIDIRADLLAPETRSCLLQLSQEMPYFRVLGCRPAIHDCHNH